MRFDEIKNQSEYRPLFQEQARYEAEHGTDEDNERVVHEPGTRRQIGGAAIAGGVAGLLVLGPFGGLILAGGAAALAASRGEAGDLARSTGTVTSNAVDQLKAYDHEHHIVEKTSRCIAKGCNWIAKKLNEKDAQENTAPVNAVRVGNAHEKDAAWNDVQAVRLH